MAAKSYNVELREKNKNKKSWKKLNLRNDNGFYIYWGEKIKTLYGIYKVWRGIKE